MDGLKNILDIAEKRIIELEYSSGEIVQKITQERHKDRKYKTDSKKKILRYC